MWINGFRDEDWKKLCVAVFVPVELQCRGFNSEIFMDLVGRAFERVPEGVKQVQPWCRWQGLSQYLDCAAFADRAASCSGIGHVTPGRFYSVGIIFITQALIDNVAVWFCDALSLPVRGGDRHFLSSRFTRGWSESCLLQALNLRIISHSLRR